MDVVPATATEALTMFIEALENDEKDALRDVDDDQTAIFHDTMGKEIRNEWSMYEKDTRLYHSFKAIGITHPDDMSGIIIQSAHRQLNNKPIKLKEQVSKYQVYWKKEIGKPMP